MRVALGLAFLALLLQSEPPRVAVLEFVDDGGKATEAVAAALKKAAGVSAIEPAKVSALLAETKERNPVALGKLLGVDLVVTGTLASVRVGQESVLGEVKSWNEVTLVVRVTSVATGELVGERTIVARAAPGEAIEAAAAKAVAVIVAASVPKAKGRPRSTVAEADRPRLCVIDLVDKGGFPVAGDATEALIAAMAATRQLRILDRATVRKVLDEMKSAAVGDPVTAAKVGKQLDAKAIAYGAVTEVGVKAEMNDGKKRWVAVATITLRVVDVASGEVAVSESLTGTAAGGTMDIKALTGAALRAAIESKIDVLLDAVIAPACAACRKPAKVADLCATCGGCKACCHCGK
jgi:curli biogenesis system outer membrane secretion channel CsgG